MDAQRHYQLGDCRGYSKKESLRHYLEKASAEGIPYKCLIVMNAKD